MKDAEIKRWLATQFHELGDELGGRRVLASIDLPTDEEVPIGRAGSGSGEWEKLVRAAAADPDDLWRYA